MSTKRVFVAVGLASVLVVGLAPLAHAAQVGARVCIQRDDAPGPRSRLRDTVERPAVDRLQGWIAKHPKLASGAAKATAANEIVTIRTWIHVLRADTTVAGGNVPRAWIDAQVDVLNASFSGETGGRDSGFRFRLAGVTRTTNADWFDMH